MPASKGLTEPDSPSPGRVPPSALTFWQAHRHFWCPGYGALNPSPHDVTSSAGSIYLSLSLVLTLLTSPPGSSTSHARCLPHPTPRVVGLPCLALGDRGAPGHMWSPPLCSKAQARCPSGIHVCNLILTPEPDLPPPSPVAPGHQCSLCLTSSFPIMCSLLMFTSPVALAPPLSAVTLHQLLQLGAQPSALWGLS
jgi:hypothetical protein